MKQLLLLGGGHVHLHILKQWATEPIPDTQLTVVSPAGFTAYSGMFPGWVEGFYTWKDVTVDLRLLSGAAKIKYVEGTATLIDADHREVVVSNGERFSYDVLSIDIGSGVSQQQIPGVQEYAFAMKPYSRLPELPKKLDESERIVVVGGGAAGVELAFSTAARRKGRAKVTIVSTGSLVGTLGRRASKLTERITKRKGIDIIQGDAVSEVLFSELRLSSGTLIPYDMLLWATGPTASALIRESGLPCDEKGYMLVDERLAIIGGENIFGAGDCVTLKNWPNLPKAGVYAVRQAPVLWHNLRAALTGDSYETYEPQRNRLSLLYTGNGETIASYGRYAVHGSLYWRWKRWIDEKYMSHFHL